MKTEEMPMTMPAVMAQQFLYPNGAVQRNSLATIAQEPEHQSALEMGLDDLHAGRKTKWEDVKKARGWV